MTDGTTQAAGQTGGQSSSQASGQQSSASTGAQDGASQTTQSSQGTTTNQQAATGQQAADTGTQQKAPERPAYVLDEKFWDKESGKVKDKEFSEHINAQTARIAADESRRLSLPQNPEAYQVALPKDFKAPEGTEFKFNENGPLLAQLKTEAHAQGLTQEGFSKLLGIYAGVQIGEAQAVQTAKNAEVAKLGPAGPSRVDAVTTFLKATLGDAEGGQIASRMFTASDVQIMEKLVARFASQGTASFSQQHRDTQAPQISDADWNKMSYSAQKEHAAKYGNSKAA